ncbi:putative homeobox-leucine zipper protein ATHB-51 [Amborella trichopoda]|uniref:Homeobox-leucine zipper protein n=1 Tax=Amborella trichopoda TaxID=13333 RepID=W1Q052_AMBTC|nr:putative homeobox-leucine zipper protein ATHB-51 [Amborella trichopoda]ERN13260.1 hypothetical protein AMTR_s00040p00235500 [Amborella trichopoda]|eukprot:XP_006851793.1 putative homeobox-leucine zipper protein ATHB-51 [Amborella trichopoda]
MMMPWNGNLLLPPYGGGGWSHSPSMAAVYNDGPGGGAMGAFLKQEGGTGRKRRLSEEQIESLEKCFQEETKLQPERKMRLAGELGLHPRQVAVWFQNRRARWKSKQVEHLYHSLKHQFHLVSKEKQKLHEEVLKLRAELRERERERGMTAREESGVVELSTVGGEESASACVGNATTTNYEDNGDEDDDTLMKCDCHPFSTINCRYGAGCSDDNNYLIPCLDDDGRPSQPNYYYNWDVGPGCIKSL